MNINVNRIVLGEKLYSKTKKTRHLSALAIRHWLIYRHTGDRGLIQKANHAVVTKSNESPCAELFFLIIFLNIEMQNYSIAEGHLDKFAHHRGYLKNNKPIYYGIFLFLQSLLEMRIKSGKSVNKPYKLLEEYSQTNSTPIFRLLLGWLKLGFKDAENAWLYFEDAFNKGSRSVFLYACCYEYLSYGMPVLQNSRLLTSFIKWSLAQGISIDDILEQYYEQIVWDSWTVIEKLYKKHPNPWMLKDICEGLIKSEDYSESAYKYYKEAEHRQIELDGMSQALIKSAYKNKVEDISRYTMNSFLKSAEMDIDLKAYVYHLLLTSKKLRDFASEYSNGIVQFSVYCLENNISGRYYNSIYKHFIEIVAQEPFESSEKYIAMADAKLLDDLFSYLLLSNNEQIRHVWITEKEKREMSVYEMKNGQVKILASSESFSYICFSSGVRNIIDEKLKILKLVENADINLYLHFFQKGVHHPNILIALARHCIGLEKLDEHWLNVLKLVLPSSQISYSFKMQIYARLGNYYYANNELDTALKYYEAVDENYLNDKYVERMLEVFINAKALNNAAQLISKKAHCLSDRILFQALKQIAQEEELKPLIAITAYELLLKSWYDKVLLEIVLNHFKGCQEDWEELCKGLALMSIYDPELDSAILQNSIWIRRPNAEAQKVFIRIYKNDRHSDLVGMFVYYLVYEIIINNFKIQYDTIAILEEMYKNLQDKLLAYTLSHLYLAHGITTLSSEEILQDALEAMEKDGIIFPIFKANQDKPIKSAYIEKNQAFMYRCLPEKNVFVYYRVEGEEEYRKQKMIYFRFGLYFSIAPHFYGEKLEYYFSEEIATGSLVTKKYVQENNHNSLYDSNHDSYFVINNALIYEQMFRYDKVESIITDSLEEFKNVKAVLL